MSYTDNVANFLEAQQELEQLPIGDLELVAGDVIERVRSQPNSPFASREASPQRVRSSLETSPSSSLYSRSPDPVETDHSDDEYIDTIDSAPESGYKKSVANGYIPDSIPNGHIPKETHGRSRAKTRLHPTSESTNLRVDISQEISKTIQSLKNDIERLSSKVSSLEKTSSKAVVKKGIRFSFRNVSPSFLAFILLWPFITHSLIRYWSNRK